MNFIIAFLVLSFLVLFHELGHFIIAKLFKVEVEAFSMGFGKVLLKYKYGKTEYRLSSVPLGGYVMLKGQNDLDPACKDTSEGSYQNLHPIKKILILLGGPVANILIAFILFFIITLKPIPYISSTIGEVVKNAPAHKAGLHKGDTIISIGDSSVKTWKDIIVNLKKDKSNRVAIKVLRKNRVLTKIVKPELKSYTNIFNEKKSRYIIGIVASKKTINIKLSLKESFVFAYEQTKDGALLIVKGVEKLLTNSVSYKQVGGVISMVQITGKAVNSGLNALLFIVALISINLGILNLLPIPALDGGHIIFTLYELVTKKIASKNVMIVATYVGWFILLFLMLLGFYNDILRLITG